MLELIIVSVTLIPINTDTYLSILYIYTVQMCISTLISDIEKSHMNIDTFCPHLTFGDHFMHQIELLFLFLTVIQSTTLGHETMLVHTIPFMVLEVALVLTQVKLLFYWFHAIS